MWSAADNHNNVRHICAKELLDRNFNKKLFTKYQILTKMPQIAHILKNRNF